MRIWCACKGLSQWSLATSYKVGCVEEIRIHIRYEIRNQLVFVLVATVDLADCPMLSGKRIDQVLAILIHSSRVPGEVLQKVVIAEELWSLSLVWI